MVSKLPESELVASFQDLADRALEAPDLESLARVLTERLPACLGLGGATLLLWDRKLDSFETLQGGRTRRGPVRSGDPGPRTRYLVSDGALIETGHPDGRGTLVPLLARSGLVGMLVLDEPPGASGPPLGGAAVKGLSVLAHRAALALENQVYHRELVAWERTAALGTMAGTLAHDFRGPMTVIKGCAETLLEPSVSAQAVKDRARLIVQAVERLERMTTETLDYARGGGRLVCRPVPVRSLLSNLASGLVDEQPGLTIVQRLEVPADIEASVDVDKLARVLGNLAANAADAMGGQGRFHISARLDDGDRLILALSDEGPGVAPEIRDRVFDPFVSHGKTRGTGLGLAVARRFVEDHGGSLVLLPEGPGARFRILLPLARPSEERGPDTA